MGAGANIANGALNTLTGNIESAQLIIHDYRDIAARSKAGSKALPSATMLAALNNERIAATKAALDSGTAPSYPNSQDKTFKVQFNPSELTLNASAVPYCMPDATNDKARAISVEDPKLLLSVVLHFDAMDPYDSFMAEKFTSGLSAKGIANIAKIGMDIGDTKDKPSVRPQVEALVAALRNPYTRTISFRWADFSFIGQLTAVQARYTMFSTSGRPVRAQVLLRLHHEMDPVMLHNWYQNYEKIFKGDKNSLTSAGQYVGNLLNF